MKKLPIDDHLLDQSVKAINAAKKHLAVLAFTGRTMTLYAAKDGRDCRFEISVANHNADRNPTENFYMYMRNNVQLTSVWSTLHMLDTRFMTSDIEKAIRFVSALQKVMEREPWST